MPLHWVKLKEIIRALIQLNQSPISVQGSKIKPAEKARDYLRSLVVNQTVIIERYDTDRYGRTVADLFVNGEPVGEVMIRSGHEEVMPR